MNSVAFAGTNAARSHAGHFATTVTAGLEEAFRAPREARATPALDGRLGGLNLYAYVDGHAMSKTDPRGLDYISMYPMMSTMLNPPQPPSACYPDDDCKSPMTISYRGVCAAGDVLCGQAMTAAGIQGPYYPETKTYSLDCLLKFGIGVKAAGSAATTIGLQRAAAAGIPGAAGAAAFANNPLTMVVSGAYTADAVFKHCECNGR